MELRTRALRSRQGLRGGTTGTWKGPRLFPWVSGLGKHHRPQGRISGRGEVINKAMRSSGAAQRNRRNMEGSEVLSLGPSRKALQTTGGISGREEVINRAIRGLLRGPRGT